MHNFKDLKIWQEAILLTKTFPKSEQFGLTSQINRCSVSVPSNIAKSSSGRTSKAFIQYLDIAPGSCYELETQIFIAKELTLTTKSRFETIEGEIINLDKMINDFIKKLKKDEITVKLP